MGVIVSPTITIDGRAVACTADRIDSEPVAIRGLSIDWGRTDYHDSETSPSSLTMMLTDATGEWANRIKTSAAIGRKVTVTVTARPTTSGPTKTWTMFRGRISTATATPMTQSTKDGRRRWRIELVVADRTAEMGNAIAGPEEWPVESMLTRAIKIRDLGLSAGSEIAQVYFWPGYVEINAGPLDVKGKSALELMGELYRSMGNDSYAYDHGANVVRQAIRLSQPMKVHLGSFDDSQGAVLPVVGDITVDNVVYPGIALGGCELLGEPSIHADPSTDINRLECTWPDWSIEYKDHTTVTENVAPGDSRRVMAWDSWLSVGEAIDPTLENVWNRVREEGRRPRHPEIRTPPSHEFVTERMARWILACWENTRPAYIAGSLPYQWLMGSDPAYPPIVAPIGGTTTFDPETGWSATLRVHWIHNQTPPATPATWTSIRQIKTTTTTPSVPWWYALLGIPAPPPVTVGSPTPERDLTWGEAGEGVGYRWADSVTWGDLQHVPTTGTQIIDHLD
ncbi:hypothetical protein [Corynebacterium senegalense]|uniref:hypothetical protein n=1 Tax=Corynebacterium senegalense TaxID=2080750 RepID=UPI000E1FD432|nr:hypothetical protein [Corynebacterium senegalense]